MARCWAINAKKVRCPQPARPGIDWCDIHDPDGKFRKQRPSMVVQRWVPEPYNPVPVEGATRVYTDGACKGNPGPGGWGWVVQDNIERSGSGSEPHTTNQRMELAAALDALRMVQGPVTIVSDSRYLIDCFHKKWWVKWLRTNWMRGPNNSEPVKNRDLWEPLVLLVNGRGDVSWEWVKGHAGDRWNEVADSIAVRASNGQYAV